MQTIPAKTIVTRTKSTGWFGTRYNMNIYRGCCHGCIYCDSRSDCYGIDAFDTVRAKENALSIIRDDLRRKAQPGVIGTGAMSDPYNPFEKETQLTRHALELIAAFGFGVAIATKSSLITRDIDVLKEIQKFAPVLCKITITTTDDALAKIIEPHAPPPSERLQALAELHAAGIPTCILFMPVLPWITDTKQNIAGLVSEAEKAGVMSIYPAFGLTMRDSQRAYFYQKLDEHFPALREKYMHQYGTRYSCASPKAKSLWHYFALACENAGILYQMKSITRRYQYGYENNQLTFL